MAENSDAGPDGAGGCVTTGVDGQSKTRNMVLYLLWRFGVDIWYQYIVWHMAFHNVMHINRHVLSTIRREAQLPKWQTGSTVLVHKHVCWNEAV